jgi:diguanylate cyclase (GGDEF)-like protein
MPSHELKFSQYATVPKSLACVLGQSERIKDIVEECAEELSSVNLVLKEKLGDRPAPSGVESALRRSATIEGKVQVCADDLTIVNRALEQEVKERQVLEQQLRDMTSLEEAARHSALHDPLTGLPNRVLFADRLEHGLAQARRHGWMLSVMFIDLDNFKGINDIYGHAAGDKVLRTVAGRLKKMTRAEDTVSRQGGDEFLCLSLEIANEAAALAIAEKIIRTVGEPCDLSTSDVAINQSIKISIGIAMYPRDGASADALVKHADQAMYHAKQKNRVCV